MAADGFSTRLRVPDRQYNVLEITLMDDPKPLEPPTNAQPLTSNSGTKTVHEQLESERKWLDAAQNWAKEDRANFKILFDRTYWFIAVIVAVVGIAGTILGLNSLQQIQKQALETAHAEVHRRLAEEFQTEKVQALVRSAAKERLEIVATPIIRDEVASALKERTSQLETAYQNVNKLLNEYQRKSDEINERLRQTAPRILTADNAKRLTGRLLLRKGIPVSVSIGVDEGEVRRYAM